MHVIVDNPRSDPWAVAAAVAAIVAAIASIIAVVVAARTLHAERRELSLAEKQLAETQRATRQTQEALEQGRRQIEFAQRADVDRMRAYAPRITARIESGGSYMAPNHLHLENAGAMALRVLVTAQQNGDGKFAKAFLQKLAGNEDVELQEFWIAQTPPPQGPPQMWIQRLRIRAFDVLGNKYITEYRSLGTTLAYPTFREPWLGRQYGVDVSPRPERCSEEVSWAVEHYERLPAQGDEPVEQGFNIEDPA